jgi:squalene monooxygenase
VGGVEETVDVVVAGAGMAGAAVTAALSSLGYQVLAVEPGLDRSKRLAGELVHPPGVSDLQELGLLAPLRRLTPAPVLGFAVLPDAASEVFRLPYGEIPGVASHGFAIDHAALAGGLLDAIARLPHITLWLGARVTGVELDHPDFATVTIIRDSRPVRLRARLLVGADGASSTVRKLAGIRHERARISCMSGYLLRDVPAPHPGFASVFLGGSAPALAYAVGPDAVRVTFDVPAEDAGADPPRRDGGDAEALPEPLRSAVRDIMGSRSALVSANYSVVPESVYRGRLVLVGDAAGCCHPLTATGLSVASRDAIRLRQALRETCGDVPAALRRYAQLREGPQRTRVALAEALYEAFVARTPEMRLLRRGILRFWARSRRGRAASLALLATHEGRMSVLAVSYAHAVGYAMTELVRRRVDNGSPSLRDRVRAAYGLSRAMLRIIRAPRSPGRVTRIL